MKKRDHIKMHSYPGMVAVVGVHTEKGVNFMSAGWHAYLSMDPPMYGVAIGRERYTYEEVKEAAKFSINFLPYEQATFIQYSGTFSGEHVDKGSERSWYLTESSLPLLKDAYLAYECDLDQMIPTGDHDWVVGDIHTCHYKDGIFGDDGLPNFDQLNIPLYLGRSTYLKLDSSVERTEIERSEFNKKS